MGKKEPGIRGVGIREASAGLGERISTLGIGLLLALAGGRTVTMGFNVSLATALDGEPSRACLDFTRSVAGLGERRI